MKHLKKKLTYSGAKKGSKPPPPKPPILRPPRVGNYKIGASYQFSENVDLICHGPIDGLCNRFGSRLDNSQLLQGIYLNGVPIEQSVTTEKIRINQSSFEGQGGLYDIIERLNEIGEVVGLNFENPEVQKSYQTQMNIVYNKYGKYQTAQTQTYTFKKNVLGNANLNFSDSKPMSYWVNATLINRYKGKKEKTQGMGIKKYGDQRFTKSIGEGGKYAWPKMANQKFLKDSSPYRAVVDGTIDTWPDSKIYLEYSPSWSFTREHLFKTWNLLYSEGPCNPTLYQDASCVVPYKEGGVDKYNQSVSRKGVNDLINISNNRTTNPFEYEYLKKKLEAYGLSLSGDQFKAGNFITQIADKFGRASDFEIENSSATAQGDLVKPYIAFKFQNSYILDGYIEAANENEFVDPANGKILDRELDFVLENYDGNYDWYEREQNTVNLLIPRLNKTTGKWNGQVRGFYLNFIRTESKNKIGTIFTDPINANATVDVQGTIKALGMLNSEIQFYKKITSLGIFQMPKSSSRGLTKYNYLNVLAEYRDGSGPEQQRPLSFFKNIYLDRNIQKRLIGPFNIDTERRMQSLWNFDADGIYFNSNGDPRQRSLIIAEQNSRSNSSTADPPRVGIPAPDTIPRMAINPDTGVEDWLLALEEGSSDRRPSTVKEIGYRSFNFSDWNSFKQDYNEKAQPVTHVIYNPNVESVYLTLNVEGLWDTLHVDEKKWADSKVVGSKLPGIVNIRVEVGYISPQDENDKGKFTKEYDRFFRIISLIEGGAGIDIGNPDNSSNADQLNYVKELYKDSTGKESNYTGSIIQPFELPPAQYNTDYGFEQIFRERYIKVTKLSTESNSTLIQKVLNLAKVTEIVPRTLSYPYSAIIGTKVDSRSFGEIPKRSFDARLRLVKIPSNYQPLNSGGTDKRFWNSAADLEAAGKSSRTRVYDGDWNGSFKIGWTDNPAWIIYDLLTNQQIGLGDLIDEEQINKWQLYKIGRFCDAVDDRGYFVGVSDNILTYDSNSQEYLPRGGRQPRYSCNTLFRRDVKIFDALNSIASNFRGLMYFADSVVSFSDDRIKEPIMTFTNDNVVESVFNYSAFLKDEQYNAIEVAYNDGDDNFEAKIEYVENEADIRERGLIKTKVDAFGTTSRAQARRYGRHLLYQAVQENEKVSFSTGLEGILVRPGDLIIIEDELRSLTSNFGKVLGVDKENYTIRISDLYDNQNFEGSITVYIPTGSQQIPDIDEILLLDRERHDFFRIFGTPAAFSNKKLEGLYDFNSYRDGFKEVKDEGDDTPGLKDEYAFYTGEQDGIEHFLWFSTLYTGWIFSTGQAFTHSPTYDKYISPTSGETNGVWETDFENFNDANLAYNWYAFTTVGDGRNLSSPVDLSESWTDLRKTKGAVVDDDIRINETKQIQDIKIASGVRASDDSIGYTLYVDQNDESSIYTPLIPKGSIYRFKRKNTNDRVYKVQTINEEDTHSYEIIATAFKSGKYREIEETNYADEAVYVNPYEENYQADQSKYFTLAQPGSPSFTVRSISLLGGTTTASVEAEWNEVSGATGYRIGLRQSFEADFSFYDTVDTSFVFEEITANGQYRVYLQSLGAVFDNDDFYTHYLDSPVYYATVDVSKLDEDTITEGAVIDSIVLDP